MLASDVNNFFHRPFQERFIGKGIFETYTPYAPNNYLEKAGFADPSGNYTMLTANMLVMAVDTERLGSKSMPKTWSDLLTSDFEDEIIMRGEDDFFCNAVMLPFYKDHGFGAIRQMAKNIRTGKHPAEMVKLADKGGDEAATIYIMPYFFAKRIKNPGVSLLWPEDGAIASPVFMMVRKSAIPQHQSLLNFLLSKEVGEMLVSRYFPTIHPDVENTLPGTVKWLGWDFLNKHDIGKLKDEIRDEFMNVWKQKVIV
jgi:ABC-type Fe3+ transport system substrate-binding protein